MRMSSLIGSQQGVEVIPEFLGFSSREGESEDVDRLFRLKILDSHRLYLSGTSVGTIGPDFTQRPLTNSSTCA